MANAQPPSGMVALWPKSRGPLTDGQIVRLENGRLAEWFPIPLEWPELSRTDSPLDHHPPLNWAYGPDGAWISWTKLDAPCLAEVMREAREPAKKADILRGLSSLAAQNLESPGPHQLVLDPETIFAPFGWTSDISNPLKVLSIPRPQNEKSGTDKIRDWETLLGKLGEGFWGEEGFRFQSIAHKLANRQPDAEIGVSSDLREWADRLAEKSAKKRRKGRLMFLGGAALFCLFVSTVWGLANWYRSVLRIRELETINRQEKLLREEQARLLAFEGRALTDGFSVPLSPFGAFSRIGPQERTRWRSWMRIAATFDKGDGSYPDLLNLRAVGHELLEEKTESELIWTRLAGTTGLPAARACLYLARQKKDRPEDSREWLGKAESTLDPGDTSPESEFLRGEIAAAQAGFSIKSEALADAEKLNEESRLILWQLLDKAVMEERSRIRGQALVALLPIMPENERKLGKISNLLDQVIADFPAFYPATLEKIRLLMELRQNSTSRSEASLVAMNLYRTVIDSWARFPERKENRLAEIGAILDAALLVENGLNRGGPQVSSADEVWSRALAKMEEVSVDQPRDPAVLREMGRVWMVGAMIADRSPNRLGQTLDYYRNALVSWELLIRLNGPSTEVSLVVAQIHQEMSWAAQRLGDTVFAQEQRKVSREIIAKILKDYPGSVDALETLVRIEETIIWDAIVSQSLTRARLSLGSINAGVLQFREGIDSGDRERFQWILMRRGLLDILIELTDTAKIDGKKMDRLFAEINGTLARNKKEGLGKSIEFIEEMDRIRARLASLEGLRLKKEKASREKVETQFSKARVAQNKAVWSDWEKAHFDALWLGIR